MVLLQAASTLIAPHTLTVLLGITSVLTGAAVAFRMAFKEPVSLDAVIVPLLGGTVVAAFAGVHFSGAVSTPALWITLTAFELLAGCCAGYGAIVMLRGLVASFRHRRDDEQLFDETNTGFVFYLGLCIAIPYIPVLIHSLGPV